MHFNTFLEMSSSNTKRKDLNTFDVLVFPGGFSYADSLGAGVFMAFKLELAREWLQDFIVSKKLILGICNGCQILLRFFKNLGISITINTGKNFICNWQELEVKKTSIWFKKQNQSLALPIAHKEGRFQGDIPQNLIALTYKNTPNGSAHDVAAITDTTGQILFSMPHPERAIQDHHQPMYHYHLECIKRSSKYLEPQDNIFDNAYSYFMQ
ncbi:MAG: phosphoribosylformylglycinamidine synthase 1 [Candidatus Xenolissoclinum pacificiensis L6]|uniref:Phosphoribosylformylglycinamidine synthase 1 n=1 Tax=Candidatus Xenolissoclinum pacificiensis L6 TaxID=1401685 RepID=W2V0P1_9RICK|nr:MAG: phosphoribosylformylglycinamidine synthase 1 [Candidatus Xenolissoclinum pacificiensis L6]